MVAGEYLLEIIILAYEGTSGAMSNLIGESTCYGSRMVCLGTLTDSS